MIPISLNLIIKNEADNLSENLNWLSNCPAITEVVCIDDFSTDSSLQILKTLSQKHKNIHFSIHQNPLNNNFAKQRELALSKSKNDWILWLDADEIPSQKMIDFLNNFQAKTQSYSFKRQDIFIGKVLKHGETANQNFTRLFNKKHGHFQHPVHEIWQSNKETTDTNLEIIHHSHPTLYSFMKKINFYSDIRATELHQAGVHTNLFQIIFFPLLKFIQNYIFRLGFLDSIPGIILALSMSFHSFLVRAKLWQLSQK